ncbi:MAG: trigger factor [Neisseriaceae bacterium]
MTTQVKNLGGLERELVLALPLQDIEKEVSSRLREKQKRARLNGFRPGKTPLKIIENMYGSAMRAEVIRVQAAENFYANIANEKIDLAGLKKLEVLPKDDKNREQVQVVATFEVMPGPIELADWSNKEIDKVVAQVTDADVKNTLELLRRQKVQYEPVKRAAKKTDRAVIDFEGTIDGVPFEGGSAENYTVLLGSGYMLADFEEAILGLKPGQTKEAEVRFPENYPKEDLVGKTALFKITLKTLAKEVLPKMDEVFAKSLGIVSGDLEELREEVKSNLTREVARRVDLINRDKVIALLLSTTDFELPQVMVEREYERLREMAVQREQQKSRVGTKLPEISDESLMAEARKSVKVGLILRQLMDKESLMATEEQVKKVIEELAQNYENPSEVLHHYLHNEKEYASAKSIATEKNVVDFVLSKVSTKEVKRKIDELIGL